MNYIASEIHTRIKEEYVNLNQHHQEIRESKAGSEDWEIAYEKFNVVESLIAGLQIALEIVEERAGVSAQLKQTNDDKSELQSIAMREWLEKIYAQQGWSDLGQFLKSQEAAQ